MLKTPFPEFPALKVMGDAHLGKKFMTDVPLHRRGDREAIVKAQFREDLLSAKMGDIVVQTGDIFDGFIVDNATVLWTAHTLREAAMVTGATFVVYRGNHDASRDENKYSSFDVLQELFNHDDPIGAVHILSEPVFLESGSPNRETIYLGFLPWHPFRSAQELAEELDAKNKKAEVVFTHCDLDAFGDNTFNVLPHAELAKITPRVVNGHIHNPEERQYGGLKVVMVGSMQPYSHSEDSEEKLYTTKTLFGYAVTDPSLLKDKHVRILLAEGENLPDEVPNCLSFSGKRLKSLEEAGEEDDSEVHIEDFDMKIIIKNALKKVGVTETIAGHITAHFEELKNKEE